MIKIPVLISACCITLYWATVVVKSFILARKIGKGPNVVPRELIGRLTRIIWGPTIIVWMVLLWRGTLMPAANAIPLPAVVEYAAAGLVIIATALTFWCWHQMGSSWRIGIDPREKTQLIVSGPYHYVLHPIYSLSMVLGIATLVTLPTLAMLLIIGLHLLMLNIEARLEEEYLLRSHGQSYRNYQKRVGRFVPVFFGQLEKCNNKD